MKLSSSTLRKAAEIQQRIERLQAELDNVLASSKDVQDEPRVQTFERLSRALGVPEPVLGRHLSISTPRLGRRRETGRLTIDESDRMGRLARLYRRGLTVLGDRNSVLEWLMTPNPSLGGRKPFDLTHTESGCVEVDRLLGRIENGVF